MPLDASNHAAGSIIDKGLATGKVEGKRQWYINRQGLTMMVVPKPGEFSMGEGAERHRRRIDRTFAMSSKEVTVDQFLQFRMDHKTAKEYAPTGDCPVNMVTWYDAAAYCNWLSEQEGIPKEQRCYLPNEAGKYADGMKMAPNYLQRTGYRLPTEAEWEYACRAGAETGYSFGETEELLGKYAWYSLNSPSRSQPVGKLRPNDQGFFDLHGNDWEWCQDVAKAYGKGRDGKATDDVEDILDIDSGKHRVLRGGSFNYLPSLVRSAYRSRYLPANRLGYFGFRPARTVAP